MPALPPQSARAQQSVRAWLLLLLNAAIATPLSAQTSQPLDPPTFQEHWAVLEVLREAKRLDDSTAFSLVLLEPPPKQAVWAWQPGTTSPRTLRVVTRRGVTTLEALIDVANRRLLSWRDVPGAQTPWLGREFGAAEDKVKQHPDFLRATGDLT